MHMLLNLLRVLMWVVPLAGLGSNAWALSPEGYPGSIWGTAARDLNGIEGYRTLGSLTQGVQWLTLPGAIPVKTYASYRWRIRSQNKTFFDAHGPAVGVEFSKSIFNFGIEHEWQSYPALATHVRAAAIFLNWYERADWISGAEPSLFGIRVLGFPTATWGRVSHDFNQFEGPGTMGFVSQAIEWFKLPADTTFRTLAYYHWRFRSQNIPYYNAHGPGLGIELGRGPTSLGAEYSWQSYPGLDRTTGEFLLSLSWYLSWNLKAD
jgi:hypothetical protein